jgi:hypothetical protein
MDARKPMTETNTPNPPDDSVAPQWRDVLSSTSSLLDALAATVDEWEPLTEDAYWLVDTELPWLAIPAHHR